MKIKINDNEYWWGGAVNSSHNMPISQKTKFNFSLTRGMECDQFSPIMLSSQGRYIWCSKEFDCEIADGYMDFITDGEIKLYDGYKNLKGAYLAAMEKYFPFSGEMPDELFWKAPQYNTWIELGTDQTTERILEYANDIIKNGLPAGVLMIDGGWQEDYGMYDECNRRKIPDLKYLVDELHKLGFKVMLWVSPIVSSAGPRYKELLAKKYLLCTSEGIPAVRKWWSGYSAVLDFTNPDAVKWMRDILDGLMEKYGVDGFKFDAGDWYFYDDNDIMYEKTSARNQTTCFNKMGEIYKFNEFRAVWNYGGKAIVSRLHDKFHTWDSFGINTIIPHTITQGLLGYAYGCPDMVGGGILSCFTNGKKIDEELFVRWAEANALMSMMQVSRAPWKVLNEENTETVNEYIKLHAKYADMFYNLAKEASKTGEPIVRHLCYEFPDEGFETVNDQFMVGKTLLVAPVIKQGAVTKDVKLPKGKWKYFDGRVFEGGKTITVDADLKTLPYFERI